MAPISQPLKFYFSFPAGRAVLSRRSLARRRKFSKAGRDDAWYVGRLKEMPAVMSQGETLEQLQSMIRDAYQLMVADSAENVFVPKEKQELSISL